LVIIRPLLLILRAILSPVYKLLFGWLDDRANTKWHKELEQEIRQQLSWLFDNYGAQVIPNTRQYPRAFDYAVVTVATNNVLLRFVRGRGELRADIAPAHSPDAWQELGEVIASYSSDQQRYYRLGDLSRVLQQNIEPLEQHSAQDRKWVPAGG